MKLQIKAITHVLAFIATWVVGLFISLANDTKNKLMVYSYAEMLLYIYITQACPSHTCQTSFIRFEVPTFLYLSFVEELEVEGANILSSLKLFWVAPVEH